jgi:hypothetical protein
MKNSLEQICETYFIELFQTHPVLRKKHFTHSDSQQDAKSNVITIEAKQGEDLLEGPRGPHGESRSKVEVTARYRSTSPTPHDNDLVADAMQTCVRTAFNRVTSAQRNPGFYLLIRNEQMSGNRDHTKSTRSRELTIPCEAGLLG